MCILLVSISVLCLVEPLLPIALLGVDCHFLHLTSDRPVAKSSTSTTQTNSTGKYPRSHRDFSLFVLLFLSLVLPFLSIVYLHILRLRVVYSYTTHNTNIHAPGGIRIRNTSRRSAANPRLRTLGH